MVNKLNLTAFPKLMKVLCTWRIKKTVFSEGNMPQKNRYQAQDGPGENLEIWKLVDFVHFRMIRSYPHILKSEWLFYKAIKFLFS
jgi:hypothetical protein